VSGELRRDQSAGRFPGTDPQKTEEYGCVFILDEVKTGFRIATAARRNTTASNRTWSTYAKALGNGYPIAAFGGKKEIMSIIGHGVAQGGTYTNNKPGVAGGLCHIEDC
jgi:glutamate-1-semialdehyde 2,1-aminomutase